MPPTETRLDQVCHVLVLDANSRPALLAVRCFGRAGLRVAVAESTRCSPAPAARSRFVRSSWQLPHPADDEEQYAGAVLDIVRRTRARLVVPVGDGSVASLRRFRACFERVTALALPAEPALDVFVDKAQTLALATSLGLRVPRGRHVQHIAQLPAVLAELGLPAIVKPVESWVIDARGAGQRVECRAVATAAELEDAVALQLLAGGTVLVQEVLPGQREAVHAFAVDGEVVARASQATDRTSPPLGGTSVLRRSTALPAELVEAADALLRATRYTGYAEVEFRRDRAGRAALMEVNPRLSASVEVPVRAGVDFPLLMWQQATGQALSSKRVPSRSVRMRWIGGDARWLFASLVQRRQPLATPPARAVALFVGEFLRPAGWDYLGWRDPLPAMHAALGFVGVVRRTLRPRRGPEALDTLQVAEDSLGDAAVG